MPAGDPWSEAGPAIAPALRGAARADVCVVGGGLTGLSAALALARGGAVVRLLEAGRVGRGASGRSGGQLIPGFRHGAAELIRRFGIERASRLHGLTLAARDRVVTLGAAPIALSTAGHLTAASHARDLAGMADEVTAMAALGQPEPILVGKAGMADHVGSDSYHGGLFDPAGGHVDPLALTLALAAAAVAAGVTINEASAVRDVAPGVSATVTTSAGEVRASDVVLACDAFAGDLRIAGRPPRASRRLMPVWSYSVATAPLARSVARRLLPGNAAVSDTRFALDYYRRSADDRLLFSGGERYTLAPLADIAGLVRPRLVRVFPELAEVAIERAWSGRVAVTTSRFPHVGREQGLWFAHGYSGHGLLLAQAAGDAIAEAILGRPQGYDLLAALPTRDWPGGALLRQPLYTAGMLWFAMRDRW